MPTVLITGANRGIGLEFARQYAADGWTVIATVRQPSPQLDVIGARQETLDLHDLDAVTGFAARIPELLDLFIANAGTWVPEQAETAAEGRAWSDMMVSNVIAPFLLARSLLDRLAAARGKLVAISSGMGSIAQSNGGYVPYRTSKAALNMAWHALAIETRGRGIVAAVLDPGWVKTRMGGPNAPIAPEQSVADMRRLIAGLDADRSGGFFRRDGTPVPW